MVAPSLESPPLGDSNEWVIPKGYVEKKECSDIEYPHILWLIGYVIFEELTIFAMH